jgi:phosphonate degradation associated HDIG domain protein
MASTADRVVDEIAGLFARRGQEHYGEDITQLEHALQTAALARHLGSPPALVAAALLHDVGHLIDGADDWGEGDLRHDRTGAAWLARHFGPEVTQPVRLHVAAKRYLCAVEADYFSRLSDASVRSLAHQGGPMSPEEVAAFRAQAGHEDGVLLRRWDDGGKVEGLEVPGFDDYRALLAGLVRT